MSNEQYLVSPEEEFELSMMRLRSERNSLLAETDWYANSDVTMSDAIKTYRQELRDITEGLTTAEEVEAVIWPTKPGT
jgi:DnaJ-domain-containing protein 1|tara:strand:+ start:389 stop:622 length:234 start_codon:yes stop_codon:yes gene_type:complete